MKRLSLCLPAVLLVFVACGKSNDHSADTSAGRPEVGVVEKVYEVINEMDRTRVGFVNLTSYDSGRVIYWVYGPDYRDKRGYVLTNNRAVKYVWRPGDTKAVEMELNADTRNSSVRRILENDKVIVLEEIDQKKLANELLGDRYAKPTGDPAKADGRGG